MEWNLRIQDAVEFDEPLYRQVNISAPSSHH